MLKEIEGKTILITGGTGFLGRALTKELLKQNPRSIRIFSRDEVKHHKFEEYFKKNPKLRNFMGDVRDYSRVLKATHGADIVIHAAALKRIDMLEYNVEESIKTNIIGTLNVVRACLENDVEKVVFVSTDKACSPVNGYGACKFVSERMMTESNFSKGFSKTIFTSVRYGNVISSTGSIVPFLIDKIKNGEDFLLTDPGMTRFLITSKQAVDLIFKALKYGIGGEVFVPKIPSFKIVDLMEYLKKEHGTKNKIKIIGMRPGEKLHELMINFEESRKTYELKDVLIITSQIEKYHPELKKEYLKNARKVKFKEYSSENNLLEGEKLEEYFKKINIKQYF